MAESTSFRPRCASNPFLESVPFRYRSYAVFETARPGSLIIQSSMRNFGTFARCSDGKVEQADAIEPL